MRQTILKILIFDQMNRAIECASEKVSQAGLHQYQLLNMNLQYTSLHFEMRYVWDMTGVHQDYLQNVFVAATSQLYSGQFSISTLYLLTLMFLDPTPTCNTYYCVQCTVYVKIFWWLWYYQDYTITVYANYDYTFIQLLDLTLKPKH